jgi:2,4-dienoyl-CoA reductase-like NADH-dependent reductase (Old Yellow Enzyme family)
MAIEPLAAFYAARAHGGAGVIVTGTVGVNPQALHTKRLRTQRRNMV